MENGNLGWNRDEEDRLEDKIKNKFKSLNKLFTVSGFLKNN